MSHEFGISLAYLGRYFKKHTGKTMQDYIASYKTKLIENRLRYSTMRLSEIVDELGFADESHFNKFFKKQKGMNPSEYRKNLPVS
ncbi:helix-turn-helix domain-containing protein [Chitinophaga pinensis]|uniref:helix-turn-helix domain-containing protein n=1 Tax=Chitinophaga pinensis TaxID=79329 RepID=UPI001C99357E|nr:helix-turn-helix domain-containing protein [Chitinophaga pinensis]